VKLLMKYCKKAAEISDGEGCLPLHYAVRPSDEVAVMKRALTVAGSISNENGATDPMGSVCFGANLHYRAKSYFKAFHDATELGRYRVRRLKRRWKFRQLRKSASSHAKKATAPKPENASTGIGLRTRSRTAPQTTVNGGNDHCNGDKEKSSPTEKDDRSDMYASAYVAPPPNPDMYDSPSKLICAMMQIGTIDEDSALLVDSEWSVENTDNTGRDANKAVLAKDYPLVTDPERFISNGVIRANRPWKTEQNRIDVVRLLANAYIPGMGSQSDDGGETPMILCCRTFKSGNDGDEFDDGMGDFELEAVLGDFPMQGNNINNVPAPVVDEIGEDEADYEIDLPPPHERNGGRGNRPNAEGAAAENGRGRNDAAQSNNPAPVEGQNNNQEAVAQGAAARRNIDAAEGAMIVDGNQRAVAAGANNIHPPPQQNGNRNGNGGDEGIQNDNVAAAEPQNNGDVRVNNGDEPDPLEALFLMIDLDESRRKEALGTPDDEGETPIHTATRIGAPPRLVRRLLRALPSSASTPAEDGATPLHLVCRRASHLAPEGAGGLATYDAETIRMFADAAGSGTLIAADDEGRIPIHVACFHGASPAAIAALADADGGDDSLLCRDMEGHAPLGVYCKHSTDFHGLRVLVERCSDAAAAVGDGKRLPIHRVLATFNLTVNVDVLKLLGTAYPRGIDAKDGNKMTALALLCNSYRSPLSIDLPKLKDGRTTLGRCLSNKIWLMVKYLVLSGKANRDWNTKHAIFDGVDEDGERVTVPPPERILHATLRDPASSVEIVMLAMIIHSDQLFQSDEEGNRPLHLCCLRDSGYTKQEDDDESDDEDLPPDDDEIFNRANSEHVVDHEPNGCEINITNRLGSSSRKKYDPYMDFNPILHCVLSNDLDAAALRNSEEKFPFNILVEKGSTWVGGGIERVLKAFPGALFSYDMNTAVFVRAIGRVANYSYSPHDTNPGSVQRLKEEQAKCIGAVFQLLKGKPIVLERADEARRRTRRKTSRESAQCTREMPKSKKSRT